MKVLIIAPHNDDEILGVGGTIARHVAQGDEVYVCEVTSSLVEERKTLLQNEAKKAHRLIGVKDTIFLNFTVVELPHEEIRKFNKAIFDVIKGIEPEIVYLPFYGDMHADHKAVADSVMVAVRPLAAPWIREVYMYETLSETGWNYPTVDKAFIPNYFVNITEYIDIKESAMKCYESQLNEYPHPRSIRAIKALAGFRGSNIGVEYAEAFMCIRRVFM